MTLRMDQRAAHYQIQANRLRELADQEAVPEMGAQLRGLAQECQELADNLNPPSAIPQHAAQPIPATVQDDPRNATTTPLASIAAAAP